MLLCFGFIFLVIKAKQDQSNWLVSIYCVTDFMAKCVVAGRYFVVGGKIAGCWHILTGLQFFIRIVT